VNRKTLYDAVREGRVPGVIRLGRSIRIGRTALLFGSGATAVLRSEMTDERQAAEVENEGRHGAGTLGPST
jgi:hypothetical protein